MAERRMFTKKITESDAFLDMPMSTQCLYFHLNMAADDDGFVNNPKRIQRLIGANDDDMKLLIAKSFIILFESGIIVIKHWKMHNYIQSDRYKPTDYIDEKNTLILKKNKAYTLTESTMDTKCIQNVSVGKDRLGKDRLGKDSINTLRNEVAQSDMQDTQKPASKYAKHFEDLWKIYPRKKEKSNAYRAYNARLKDGYSEDELMTAVQKYAKECDDTHREERYIKLCATFLGPNTPFTDYLKGGTDEQPGGEHTESKYSDYQKEYFSHYGITDL